MHKGSYKGKPIVHQSRKADGTGAQNTDKPIIGNSSVRVPVRYFRFPLIAKIDNDEVITVDTVPDTVISTGIGSPRMV